MLNPYSGTTWIEFIVLFFQRIGFVLTHPSSITSDELQIFTLALIATSSALIGIFLIYRKMTMLANALSHSILFGIALTYLIMRCFLAQHNITMNFQIMFIAALITGFITAFFSELISILGQLHKEAAVGLVFTTLFAAGIVLISLYFRNAHIGIELVLGNVDALHIKDLANTVKVLFINLSLVLLFFGGLKLTTFDPTYAKLRGLSNSFYSYLVIFMLSITAIGSFRAVGIVLVLSFFVVPPLIAKAYSASLNMQIIIAITVGVLASFLGVSFSRHFLSTYKIALSTGGITVLMLFALFFINWMFLFVIQKIRSLNLLKKQQTVATSKT